MTKEAVLTIDTPGAGFGLPAFLSRWTPADLGAKRLIEFDAGNLTSLTVNGSNHVTAWASLVGGYTLDSLLYPSANQPVYDADGWDGTLPCINFTAAAGAAGSALFGVGPNPDAGMFLFAVAERGTQLDGSGNGYRIVVSPPACLKSAVRQVGILGVMRPTIDAAQTALIAGQHSTVLANNSSAAAWANGAKALISGEFPNTDNIRARLNGGTAGAAATYLNVARSPVDRWYVGGTPGNDTAFGGKIVHVIGTSPDLTTNERQSLEGYLAWRWGINTSLATGHPYLESGPAA